MVAEFGDPLPPRPPVPPTQEIPRISLAVPTMENPDATVEVQPRCGYEYSTPDGSLITCALPVGHPPVHP